jgi:hypothetical protein
MDVDHGFRSDADEELRKQAMRERRDFHMHITIYLAVNLFLVAIWWFTGAGFFWPAFPIFAWGIGVVANAWEVYSRAEPTEDQIQREMNRLKRCGPC